MIEPNKRMFVVIPGRDTPWRGRLPHAVVAIGHANALGPAGVGRRLLLISNLNWNGSTVGLMLLL